MMEQSGKTGFEFEGKAQWWIVNAPVRMKATE